MLSVAKLSPGQERYYERSVADGLDDYYAGRGESPGVWVGRGALLLGGRGLRRAAWEERSAARARRRLRGCCLPAPHQPRAGPAPAHARDRGQHGAEPGGREVAGARRGADPEELPARRRLPLRGAPAGRVVALARGRVGDPAEGLGRAEGHSAAGDPRVLDAARPGRRATRKPRGGR